MSCDLFIFAGEKSGDLHGENLLKNLKALTPSLKCVGVGGPLMRAQGLECILPMEEFQVMGFVDVFLSLPKLIRQFYFVAKQILEINPKAVVFIDYPGFNLRMAKHLRKKGFTGKLCHFICPSVWAWGKKNIPLMAKNLDLLLCILPFEKTYFKDTSLHVEYVGNPLTQRLKEYPYQDLEIPKAKKVIAIFPGSRTKELKRNLPIYIQVCKELRKMDESIYFAISISDEKFRETILKMGSDEGFTFDRCVPSKRSYDLMKSAYAAISKSGTVTLELALHHTPTVVTYGISLLDLIIARDILRIRLPFYCLVNIIAGREVFKELFGPNFTKEALLNQLIPLIQETPKRDQCKDLCSTINQILQDKNASLRAAQFILETLSPMK